jgi:hypothetical protein
MPSDIDRPSARRRTLIGGGLIAVLAAALIAIVVVRSTGEKVLNENGDTVVLVGKEDATDDSALASGVLTDVGGCLGLVNKDGSPSDGLVIVWPHGTVVETPEPLRVRTGKATYALGDTVQLGGGGAGLIDASSYFYDKIPAGCRSHAFWIAG